MKKRASSVLRLILLALIWCLICPLLAACLSHADRQDQPSRETAASPSSHKEKTLILNGRRYTYSGDQKDISIEDQILTLHASGTYRISGNLTEGCLRIDAEPCEVVHLILEGVSVSSSYASPLQIVSAACVIIETAQGSVNTFSENLRNASSEDTLPLACLRADSDLTLCGEGSLILKGRSDCALASCGNVVLSSGKLTVSSPNIGIWVRDCFELREGTLTVTAARIGIYSDSGERSGGEIRILGGRLTACCSEVALSAGREIRIEKGVGSLDAPSYYLCQRTADGKKIDGTILITSNDFPAHR